MSDTLKTIVEKLNEEPFNKNYTIVKFDSLSPEQLLQQLDDVFSTLDAEYGRDLASGNNKVERMFAFLRLLNFPLSTDSQQFGERAEFGDKSLLYPILEWCLTRMADLKKRIYLAHYLLKIECPNDVLIDPEVADTYQQYEQLMDRFKSVHKQHETLRQASERTAELRRDLSAMQQEKDTVINKVQRLKNKVEGHSELFDLARRHRQQRQLQQQLSEQRQEQLQLIDRLEKMLSRGREQLQEGRSVSAAASPDGLMKQLEKDISVHQVLHTETLPRQLASLHQYNSSMRRVVDGEALTVTDIRQLRDKVAMATSQLSQLESSRRLSESGQNVTESGQLQQLAVFRQQVALVASKRQQTEEAVDSMRQQLERLTKDVKVRGEELRHRLENDLVTVEDSSDDQRRYFIQQLRSKSSLYHERKAQLEQLQNQLRLLEKPADSDQNTVAVNDLSPHGMQYGDHGVIADLDDPPANADDLARQVNDLQQKIDSQKARLAPIVKDLRTLRQDYQHVVDEHSVNKQEYDSLAAALESSDFKLKAEVGEMCRNLTELESRSQLLQARHRLLSAQKQLLDDESGHVQQSADGGKTRAEQIQSMISAGETEHSRLKSQQRSLKQNSAEAADQYRMWSDIMRFLELKRSCAAAATAGVDKFQRGAIGERWEL